MLDFGALPPEVTSAQMYSGPGSGPLMVAASAWETLAGQAGSFAQGYSSAVAGLQGEHWAGPAAAAMAAAAAPYAQWAAATGAQAEQAAVQLRAAAAGFESAHAAITPPVVVLANRDLLANLIATNVLGQNAAGIAATEAAYQGMWAQNAQAMYGYAGSASSAAKLSPFQQAPQTTNPTGQAAAATAAGVAANSGASNAQNWLTQLLQGLSAPGSGSAPSANTTSFLGVPVPNSMLSDIGTANTLLGPVNFYSASFRSIANGVGMSVSLFRLWADGVLYAPLAGLTGATSPVGAGALPSGVLAGTESSAAAANRPVLANMGTASPLGQMSVPPSWTQATPAAAAAEEAVLLTGTEELFEAAPEAGASGVTPGMGIGPMAAMAAAGMAMRPVVGNMLRVPPQRFKMPRHSGGG